MISEGQLNQSHLAFLPLLALTLTLWYVYRFQFHFPVWFDEIFGKAVFFGLPVWMYITTTRSKSMVNTYSWDGLKPGLLLGVAVGGVLGFVATLANFLQKQVIIQAAPLFVSNVFWWQFFLAMMTGFWESLFFFTWIMTAIMERYKRWGMMQQVLVTATIFVLFHIPNAFIRFSLPVALSQVLLLSFFAIGQALLFARTKNLYALTLSHAIWGMVLLVNTR